MTLPGYDAWKLASPPEPTPCTNCGHEAGDHGSVEGPMDAPRHVDDSCWRIGCDCEMYDDEPRERDPDEAYDLKREERFQ